MKHTNIKRIAIFTAIFLVALFFLSSAANYPKVLGDTDSFTPSNIITLINEERTKNKLSPLTENISLNRAAAAKAQNMVNTGNFEHSYRTDSGLIEPWQFILAEGYNYSFAGENLARDFEDPDILTKAWMDSPGHKANILSADYQEVGVSVLSGPFIEEKHTNLVVVFFASPQPMENTQNPQSFVATQILLPRENIINIISSVSPRYALTITAITMFIAMALGLDYTHHRKPSRPSLKHWKIK